MNYLECLLVIDVWKLREKEDPSFCAVTSKDKLYICVEERVRSNHNSKWVHSSGLHVKLNCGLERSRDTRLCRVVHPSLMCISRKNWKAEKGGLWEAASILYSWIQTDIKNFYWKLYFSFFQSIMSLTKKNPIPLCYFITCKKCQVNCYFLLQVGK